jgi:EAL domain-containing protein (putative c-di-GMP-specific phosphodiesterase class I)
MANDLPTFIAPSTSSCGACGEGSGEPFPFSMAFQPIVDLESRSVFAYEALVRGKEGQSASSILDQVTSENRYAFDQGCRVKAITLAAALGVARHGAKLSVNFMPGAVYSPAACIRQTLATAREVDFPLSHLIFEITEDERVRDAAHLQAIATEYKKHGFGLALDDFGAGYSGMNLLADLEIDILKLDGKLIRDVQKRPRAFKVIEHLNRLCASLDVQVIGESVETIEEAQVLRSLGVKWMQGYLFARPAFEKLPEVSWPSQL